MYKLVVFHDVCGQLFTVWFWYVCLMGLVVRRVWIWLYVDRQECVYMEMMFHAWVYSCVSVV